MRILAIETSCDDTGIAILEFNENNRPTLLADLVSSQTKIHAPWGGIVPMLAKREHQKNIVPLLIKALKKAKLLEKREQKITDETRRKSQLPTLKLILERETELAKKIIPFLQKYEKPEIDALAVTVGPGLEPALWVGVNFARVLSLCWNIPVIPINHIEGHIRANWFSLIKANRQPKFPVICLVVSGGHTQLILMKKIDQYKILGETRDDAAGEAFDKVAKMLNLGYPGGPAISRLAAILKNHLPKTGNRKNSKFEIKLPRPMINSEDFDFSFSGLKTATLYLIKKFSRPEIKKLTPVIAAEFQQAVIDVLTAKTLVAAKKYNAKTIMLSGGVAANDSLRENLSLNAERLSLNFLAPNKNFCTDNAAMTAISAYFKIKNGKTVPHNAGSNWQNIKADANFKMA